MLTTLRHVLSPTKPITTTAMLESLEACSRSYLSAAARKRDSVRFATMGCVLVRAGYTRDAINSLAHVNISKKTFANLNLCVRCPDRMKEVFGKKPLVQRSLERKKSVIAAFVNFTIENTIASAASSTVYTSDGARVEIPKRYRTMPRKMHIQAFLANQRSLRELAANEKGCGRKVSHPGIGFAPKTMLKILRKISVSKLINLAALDVVSESHGRQNFMALKVIIKQIADFFPGNPGVNEKRKQVCFKPPMSTVLVISC